MHLLRLLNRKKSLFVLILLFIFYFVKVNSNINNSVIISVGNQPITYLDLIKEMKLISFLNNIKVDETNRETVKSVAVQGLITRKIKEIEINKFKIEEAIKELDIKSSSIELIDKSILFFAINEILYGKLDKLIAIDESLRLSKKFSSPESYKFINASLDNFIKK